MANYYTARELCFNPTTYTLSRTSESLRVQPGSMSSQPLTLKWEEISYADPNAPEVWGPAFWYTIHKSALNYPVAPTNIVKFHMKNFIYSIPYLLPCEKCQEHARNFIESHSDTIDSIISTRQSLFNFFVDLHNQVNQRNGKRIMSYEHAWDLYTRKVNVRKLTIE
jgi:hypothetical protein